MTNKPSDFLDLFDLPEPTTEQVATPDPQPVAPIAIDLQDTSLFDGLLDDLNAPFPAPVEASEDQEPVDEEVEEQDEPFDLPESDEPGPAPEPEFVPDPFQGDQSDEDAVEEGYAPDNDFWPWTEDLPSEATADAGAILEERGSIEVFQSHDEAVDALVADAAVSVDEPRTILVHTAEDKALLKERLAETPQDVRLVVPADPPKSLTPLLVGAVVGVLAIGAIGWWTLSSNKESRDPTPVVATAPSPAPVKVEPIEPATAVAQAPVTHEPVLINPADIVANLDDPTPDTAPIEEARSESAPAPALAKGTAQRTSASKPKAKHTPKPEPKPAPAMTWQDDALDQLDNLEKRL